MGRDFLVDRGDVDPLAAQGEAKRPPCDRVARLQPAGGGENGHALRAPARVHRQRAELQPRVGVAGIALERLAEVALGGGDTAEPQRDAAGEQLRPGAQRIERGRRVEVVERAGRIRGPHTHSLAYVPLGKPRAREAERENGNPQGAAGFLTPCQGRTSTKLLRNETVAAPPAAAQTWPTGLRAALPMIARNSRRVDWSARKAPSMWLVTMLMPGLCTPRVVMH